MSKPLSTYTIRALVQALRYIEPRQTVLLRGRHGIGKSAIAYQMAPIWGLDTVIERRISQLSEGDIIGLPDRGAIKTFDGKDWRVTKFLPTDWFLEAMKQPCLVFLDEINRGTPEVQQACFQFVEKGELNGQKIHPGSRIITAINHSKEYKVTPMDFAFTDRFWVADVAPDLEDWLHWARSDIGMTPEARALYGDQNIHPNIIAYIDQCNEEHFEILPEKQAQMDIHEITPSRRSWHRLNNHLVRAHPAGPPLIQTPDDPVLYDLMRGFVGPDAARSCLTFLVDRATVVTPEDVIDAFEKNRKRVAQLTPEKQIELIDKIGVFLRGRDVRITEDQALNLANFMKSLKHEIGVMMWDIVSSTSLENVHAFHRHAAKFIVGLLSETYLGSESLKERIRGEQKLVASA